MAYETALKIADVIDKISKHEYILPAIQREFVWSTDQIERLFDSLMQGYPIGSFLFWEIEQSNLNKYVFYEFIKNYHELNNRHNAKFDIDEANSSKTAILDGQQRLTSLYIGLKGSYSCRLKHKRKNNEDAYPKKYLYLNIMHEFKDLDNRYEFKFLTEEEAKIINNETFWYKVSDILYENSIAAHVLSTISNLSKNGYNIDATITPINILEKLYNVINEIGTISYYKVKANELKLEKANEFELDKVLNIFVRVNSGGKPLSYSDLLLSIATSQWKEKDAREEITSFVDEINKIGDGFYLDKDFILKSSLVLSDFPNIAFKVDNFNKQNMLKIEQNWDSIKNYIKLAIKLISSFGFSGETLSSNYVIVPIAYFLKTINASNDFISSSKYSDNRSNIKRFTILCLLKRIYSGVPDNVLSPMREIIRQNTNDTFPINEIIEKFKGTQRSLQFYDEDLDEYILKLKWGKKETLSTLMLLYPQLIYSNKFHIDHIYPKSKFSKKYLHSKGITDDNQIQHFIDHVNDLSNLQLLRDILNEEKSNTDFDEWFNKICKTPEEQIEYRQANYLPDIDYTYENFLSFLEARKSKIKEKLKAQLM